jgi:hypothetical protein
MAHVLYSVLKRGSVVLLRSQRFGAVLQGIVKAKLIGSVLEVCGGIILLRNYP